jgi:hypothetical protein
MNREKQERIFALSPHVSDLCSSISVNQTHCYVSLRDAESIRSACLQRGVRPSHAPCVSTVYILLHDFRMVLKTAAPNCSIIYDPWTYSITRNLYVNTMIRSTKKE